MARNGVVWGVVLPILHTPNQFKMEMTTIELSFWPVLFLIAGGQACFFALLFWLNPKIPPPGKGYLTLLLLLFGYMLFFHFCWWTHYNLKFPHILLTNIPVYYCFGPLLLLYMDSLRKQPSLQKKWWLHFIPLFLVIFFLTPFYFLSGNEKLAAIHGQMSFPVFPGTRWLKELLSFKVFGLQMFVYLFWQIKWVRRLNQEDQSAGLDPVFIQVRYRWFSLLTVFYGLFVGSFLLYFLINDRPFFRDVHDFIISGLMTIAIYLIGYLAYQRPAIFSGRKHAAIFQPAKYATSSLTPAAVDSIRRAIVHVLEKEELYKENNLKINDLSDAIQVPPHHLSQVINDRFGKSFNQLINDYRVREVCRLLKKEGNEKRPVIQIAYEAGFNNKTTFYEVFKKTTGLSPTEFRLREYKKINSDTSASQHL